MAYTIFESTNISGKNLSFVSTVDVENGRLVNKGDLVTGSKDIYNGVLPADTTSPVYVVGNPAWSYDESSIVNQNEDAYINKAGTNYRVYELKATDKFAVTNVGVSGTAVEGEYVGVETGTGKLLASSTEPTGAFAAKVITVRDLGFEYYLGQVVDTRIKKVIVEVVKNG